MLTRGWGLLERWMAPRPRRQAAERPEVKVRVSVIVPRGEGILLVRHRRDARFYWVLPGGRLEAGESLAACGAREVREEAGLTVRIRRLLYVAELLSPSGKKHALNFIFLGEPVEGDEAIRPSRYWVIEEPRFIPLHELLELELLPAIAPQILEDARAGWLAPIRFLGNLWVDMESGWVPAAAEGQPAVWTEVRNLSRKVERGGIEE